MFSAGIDRRAFADHGTQIGTRLTVIDKVDPPRPDILIEPVGLSQPTVSHHLKVLTDAGLITRDKRGVWAYFALVPGALESVTQHLGAHLTSGAA